MLCFLSLKELFMLYGCNMICLLPAVLILVVLLLILVTFITVSFQIMVEAVSCV